MYRYCQSKLALRFSGTFKFKNIFDVPRTPQSPSKYSLVNNYVPGTGSVGLRLYHAAIWPYYSLTGLKGILCQHRLREVQLSGVNDIQKFDISFLYLL